MTESERDSLDLFTLADIEFGRTEFHTAATCPAMTVSGDRFTVMLDPPAGGWKGVDSILWKFGSTIADVCPEPEMKPRNINMRLSQEAYDRIAAAAAAKGLPLTTYILKRCGERPLPMGRPAKKKK